MIDPRCALAGHLLYVSYIISSGLLLCAPSYCSSVPNANYGCPGPISTSPNPWSQKYATNPNLLFKAGPTELTKPHTYCLSPEERTMSQPERIALKKTPGNYMYPDIPQPHKTPVHACLAGYDGEIFDIIRDIKETNGNEIEVHFYLFHRCKFNLLESHLTTVKALQDVLVKYHHYICLNKKYVETYKPNEHCWYIEKLIMIPGFKHDFGALPYDIKVNDFNRICDMDNKKNGFEPLVLNIQEKVKPGEDIRKIEQIENKYELTLRDLSGSSKVIANPAANIDWALCAKCNPLCSTNAYVPNLHAETANIPTAKSQWSTKLPEKENININNLNNQKLVPSNPCGVYSQQTSIHDQARFTQTLGLNKCIHSPYYTERRTSQKSSTQDARTFASYVHPPKSVAAYYTVPQYTIPSNTASPYQMTSSYAMSQTDAKQRQNVMPYYQPSTYNIGLNTISRSNEEIEMPGQIVQKNPTSICYTQSGQNLIHGAWGSQQIASAGYQTLPTAIYGEKHGLASYSQSQGQDLPNYSQPYCSKSQNYNQQSYNTISSYTPSPKSQMWPSSNFVTPVKSFQQKFDAVQRQMTMQPKNNVISFKGNEIKNEEINFSLHSQALVSNSPNSGLNIFYSPQASAVNKNKMELFNEIYAYTPQNAIGPKYTTFISGKGKPALINAPCYNLAPLVGNPKSEDIDTITKYTQPRRIDPGYSRLVQQQKNVQPDNHLIVPLSPNIELLHNRNRLIQATYQPENNRFIGPQICVQPEYQPISAPLSPNTKPLHKSYQLLHPTYQPRAPIYSPKIWSPTPKLYTPEYNVQSVEYSKPSIPIISDHSSVYSPKRHPVTNLESASNKFIRQLSPTDYRLGSVIPSVRPLVRSNEKYNKISTYTPKQNVVGPQFFVGQSQHESMISCSDDKKIKLSNAGFNAASIQLGNTDNRSLKWPHTLETYPSTKSYLQTNLPQPANIQIPYSPNYLNMDNQASYQTVIPSTLKVPCVEPEFNDISFYTPKITSPIYNTISTCTSKQKLEDSQFERTSSYRTAQKVAPGNKYLPYAPCVLDSQTWWKPDMAPKPKLSQKFNTIESYTRAATQPDIGVHSSYKTSTEYNRKHAKILSYSQPLNPGMQQNRIPSYIKSPKGIETSGYRSASPYMQSEIQKPDYNVISSYTPAVNIKVPYNLVVTPQLSPSHGKSVITLPRLSTIAQNVPSTVYSPSRLHYTPKPEIVSTYTPRQETLTPRYDSRLNQFPISSQLPVATYYGPKISYRPYIKTPNVNVISSYTQPQQSIVTDSSSASFISPQTICTTDKKPKYKKKSRYNPYQPSQVEPMAYFKPLPNILSPGTLGPITFTMSPQNQPKHEQATVLTNIDICRPHPKTVQLPSPNTSPIPISRYAPQQNCLINKIPSWKGLIPTTNPVGPLAPNAELYNKISTYTPAPILNAINSYAPPLNPNFITDEPQNIPKICQIPTADFNKIEFYTPISQKKDTKPILPKMQFETQSLYDRTYAPTENKFRQIYDKIHANKPIQLIQRLAYTNPVAYTPQVTNAIPKYETIAVEMQPAVRNPEHSKSTYTYTPTSKTSRPLLNTIPYTARRAELESLNVIPSYTRTENVHPNLISFSSKTAQQPEYGPTTFMPLAQKVKCPLNVINAYSKDIKSPNEQPIKTPIRVEPYYQPVQAHIPQQSIHPKYNVINTYTKPKHYINQVSYPAGIGYPGNPVEKSIQPLHIHVDTKPQNGQTVQPRYDTRVWLKPSLLVKPKYDEVVFNTPKKPVKITPVYQVSTSDASLPQFSGTTISYTPCLESIQRKLPTEYTQIRYKSTQGNIDDVDTISSYTPRQVFPVAITETRTPIDLSKSQPPQIRERFSPYLQQPEIMKQNLNMISHYTQTQRQPALQDYTPSYSERNTQQDNNFKIASNIPNLVSIPSYTPHPIKIKPDSISIPAYTPTPIIIRPNTVSIPGNQWLKTYQRTVSKKPENLVSVPFCTPKLDTINPNLVPVSPISQYFPSDRSDSLSFKYSQQPGNKISNLVSIESYTQPEKIEPNVVPTTSNIQWLTSNKPAFVPILPCTYHPIETKPYIASAPPQNRKTTSKIPDLVSISSYTPRPTLIRPHLVSIPSYTSLAISTSPDFVTMSSSGLRPEIMKPESLVSITSYTQPPSSVSNLKLPYNQLNIKPEFNKIPQYVRWAERKQPDVVVIPSYSQTPAKISPDMVSLPAYTQRPTTATSNIVIPKYEHNLIEIKPNIDTRSSYITQPKSTRPNFVSTIPHSQISINKITEPVTIPYHSERPKSIKENLDFLSEYTPNPVRLRPASLPVYPPSQPTSQIPDLVSIPSYTRQLKYRTPNTVSIPSYTQQPIRQRPHSISIPSCSAQSRSALPDCITVSPSFRSPESKRPESYVSIPSYTQPQISPKLYRERLQHRIKPEINTILSYTQPTEHSIRPSIDPCGVSPKLDVITTYSERPDDIANPLGGLANLAPWAKLPDGISPYIQRPCSLSSELNVITSYTRQPYTKKPNSMNPYSISGMYPYGVSPTPDVIPKYTKWLVNKRPFNQRPLSINPYSQPRSNISPELEVIPSHTKRPNVLSPCAYQPDGTYPCKKRPHDINPEFITIPSYTDQPKIASQHFVSIAPYAKQPIKITPKYASILPRAGHPKIAKPAIVSISPLPQYKSAPIQYSKRPNVLASYANNPYGISPKINAMLSYTTPDSAAPVGRDPCGIKPKPDLNVISSYTERSAVLPVSYPQSTSSQTKGFAPGYVYISSHAKPQAISTGNWICKDIQPDFYQIKSYTQPHLPTSQPSLLSANVYHPSLKSFNQIKTYSPSSVSSLPHIPPSTQPFVPPIQTYKQTESYTKPCKQSSQPNTLSGQFAPMEQQYNEIKSYEKPCIQSSQPILPSPTQFVPFTKPFEQPCNKISYTEPCITYENKLPDYNKLPECNNYPTDSKDAHDTIASYRKPTSQIYKNVPSNSQVAPAYKTIISYGKPVDKKVQYDRISSYTSPYKIPCHRKPYIEINKYKDPKYEKIESFTQPMRSASGMYSKNNPFFVRPKGLFSSTGYGTLIKNSQSKYNSILSYSQPKLLNFPCVQPTPQNILYDQPFVPSVQPCVQFNPFNAYAPLKQPCTLGKPSIPLERTSQPCKPYVSLAQPCIPRHLHDPSSYTKQLITRSRQPCLPCVSLNVPFSPYRPLRPCIPSNPATTSHLPSITPPCVSSLSPTQLFRPSVRPCTPLTQPCIPSIQPCIPKLPLKIPCVPSKEPFIPRPLTETRESLTQQYRTKSCLPCSTLPQPCVPSIPIPYTRPCVPNLPLTQPHVPCVSSPGQPCMPSSYRPCVPCLPSSYQSRVPSYEICVSLYRPCVPPCVPLPCQPSVLFAPPSHQPCISRIPSLYQPCVPPSHKPCVPCVPSSYQPCIPCPSSSYQPGIPCVPTINQPRIPSVPSLRQPCIPCPPSSYPLFVPCVPSLKDLNTPCVPSSKQPGIPCLPSSYTPCIPCVPSLKHLNIPCVQSSKQPCIPCPPTPYQSCMPCPPIPYQPCIPFVPSLKHLNIPCILSPKQPCIPCPPIPYQPCMPCFPSSYPPCIPSVPSLKHLNIPGVPSFKQPCIPWLPQQPINIIRKGFDYPRTYIKPISENGLRNDMNNKTDIDMKSLVNHMTNRLLKTRGDIASLAGGISLGNTIVSTPNFINKTPFFCEPIDPSVELRGYMKKVKVLKPKLVLVTEEIDVPNFVPVVKCQDRRDPKVIQRLAENFLKRMYKNPVVINKTDPLCQSFVSVKNADLSAERPLIWPAVCEFGGGCKNCCR